VVCSRVVEKSGACKGCAAGGAAATAAAPPPPRATRAPPRANWPSAGAGAGARGELARRAAAEILALRSGAAPGPVPRRRGGRLSPRRRPSSPRRRRRGATCGRRGNQTEAALPFSPSINYNYIVQFYFTWIPPNPTPRHTPWRLTPEGRGSDYERTLSRRKAPTAAALPSFLSHPRGHGPFARLADRAAADRRDVEHRVDGRVRPLPALLEEPRARAARPHRGRRQGAPRPRAAPGPRKARPHLRTQPPARAHSLVHAPPRTATASCRWRRWWR
jgi:hypothetical protein